MTNIVFISDFFANEIRGGAELCNDALITLLRKKYTVKAVKSIEVSSQLLDEHFSIQSFYHLRTVD